jgi:hypothetical protein
MEYYIEGKSIESDSHETRSVPDKRFSGDKLRKSNNRMASSNASIELLQAMRAELTTNANGGCS